MLPTRYCYGVISLPALTSSVCESRYDSTNTTSSWSCPLSPGVTRRVRDGGELWFQWSEERASLCGCRYNIHCLCHDQGGTKGSDVKQTKTIVPQCTHTNIHTHTVVCGGRGVTRAVSTPLGTSGHPPSTAVWYHGTECQCRRGPGSSVQRVGGSIMNARGNLNIFTTTTTPLKI